MARPDFPVVGIGASAGGLDAFAQLLQRMPANSGMAFVVIQHLDPRQDSILAELLGAHTTMEVIQAKDHLRMEPDHVYVIPPHARITVEGGALRVGSIDETRPRRMPIDVFFRSLAQDCGHRAIGVVLTGTGTDGTLGLKEIKDKDGLAIAQDPDEADYDGMPRSAIASGGVDVILPLQQIPNALVTYARQRNAISQPAPGAGVRHDLDKIIDFLRSATSHNFTPYKPGTLQRRIERRMAITHAATSADYLSLLERDPVETNRLTRDLLIGVTSFFRDTETYSFLEANVLPQLLKGRSAVQSLRIWVPGCSTGEEAFSLAMLLIEQISAAKKNLKVQVFACDVNEEALEVARRAIYPESIQADLSRARLDRFFTAIDHTYKVVPEVRESIVFAIQNLLTDPPFSNVDLVSCRNVLIYLKPEVQEQILALFHFALRDDGILVLGSSETIGTQTDRFEAMARRVRVYRRIGPRRPLEFQYGLIGGDGARVVGDRSEAQPHRPRLVFGELARQTLLDLYAPASVLVNRNYQGLYYYGSIDRYLHVSAGEASHDVLSMAREGLRAKMRSVTRDAVSKNAPATASGVRMKRDGDRAMVTISGRPIDLNGERLVLVSFHDDPELKRRRTAQTRDTASQSTTKALEQELESTRTELQSTIRDLEVSNEELRAANEEALSVNEEFRSTNEELETSKEELQSVNEELNAVNRELQEKAGEQRRTAAHLNDLLSSSEIVMLFLDSELHIEFFTPNTKKLFNIISSDIGRPLRDLTRQFSDPDLIEDALAVIGGSGPIRREIQTEDGSWYNREVHPYRAEHDRGQGVVIRFADILEIKKAGERLEATRAYLQSIVDIVRGPLLVLDSDLRVLSASRSFYRHFNAQAAETESRYIYDLAGGQWDNSRLRNLLKEILAKQTTVESFELELSGADGRHRIMLLNARLLADPEHERAPMILLAMEDITELRRAVEEQFQAFLDASPDPAVVVNPDCAIQYVNEHTAKLFGYPQDALIGNQVEMLMPERFRKRHLAHQRKYFAEPHVRPMGADLDIVGLTRDGRKFPLEVSLSPVEIGGRTMAVAVVRDVTERRKAERALQESEQRFREFMERAPLVCVTLDRDGGIVFCNEYLLSLTGSQRQEVEGKNWFKRFVPPEELYIVNRLFRQSIDKKNIAFPPNFENSILTSTGERRLIAWNSVLVHDSAGQVIGITSVGNEITEQRQAQTALEAAKIEAERANALKSRFLAATSHDLRQPLQTLGLLQGVLSRTIKDDGGRDVVESLGNTIASMASTIDALLDINQLESGAVKPEVIDFPASSILTRARSEFASLAEAKGLALRVVPSSAVIRSDPSLLQRLVENLVSNAVKHAEAGKVLIGCRRGGGMLRIEVWDTGVGIPSDQLEAIFEEYHQLDNPARERSRGLGLGLTLVRRMAELLDHQIAVRSTPGRGSMFAVEVPLGQSQGVAARAEALGAGGAAGRGTRVLLVEDDASVRESLMLFLRLEGYEITSATTADEALAMVRQSAIRPRVLIADLNLPSGMNGMELVGWLRAHFGQQIPAIVLTGDASVETMHQITESGAVYLRKPMDADNLLKQLKELAGDGQEPRMAVSATREVLAAHPDAPVISVVDDDRPIRDAISMLLETAGFQVETFGTCESFLARNRPKRSACLLVDVGMPGMDGLELQERLNTMGVDLPVIIIITGRRDVPLAVRAMRAGAIDFLQKPFDDEALLGAVDRALARRTQSADRADALRRIERLTPREHDVLRLIVAGHANKEVAAQLAISPRTAENHRARIMEKTNAGSLAELVRLAMAAGVEIKVPGASD